VKEMKIYIVRREVEDLCIIRQDYGYFKTLLNAQNFLNVHKVFGSNDVYMTDNEWSIVEKVLMD